MTNFNESKFDRRHTCIVCKKKRYEAHMIRVGGIDVGALTFRSVDHWVCVKGRGYESYENCGAYYRAQMEKIGSMFLRLSEYR